MRPALDRRGPRHARHTCRIHPTGSGVRGACIRIPGNSTATLLACAARLVRTIFNELDPTSHDRPGSVVRSAVVRGARLLSAGKASSDPRRPLRCPAGAPRRGGKVRHG